MRLELGSDIGVLRRFHVSAGSDENCGDMPLGQVVPFQFGEQQDVRGVADVEERQPVRVRRTAACLSGRPGNMSTTLFAEVDSDF